MNKKEMADTTLDTDVDQSTKDKLSKLYHVIILNDDDHTFDYVIEMLQAVFGFPYATALAHTMEADATGSSIVLTTNLEEAEQKRDFLKKIGSNLQVANKTLSVTFKTPWQLVADWNSTRAKARAWGRRTVTITIYG